MFRSSVVTALLAATALTACPTTSGSPDGGSATGSSTAATTSGSAGGSSGGAGSSTGSSAGGTGGGLPLSQLAAAVYQAECQTENRCGLIASYLVASCASTLAAKSNLNTIIADVDAGLVIYDPIAAATCVQQTGTVDCSILFNGNGAACQATFTGQVALGSPCSDASECSQGYCPTTAPSCNGVCTGYLEAGGSCSDGGTCDPDGGALGCLGTGSGPGGAMTCQALPTVGQTCLDGAFCAGNLSCNNGTCVAPGGAGSPCNGTCAPGFYCPESAGSGAPTCMAQVGDGGLCGESTAVFGSVYEPGYSGGECAGALNCSGWSFTVFPDGGTTFAPGHCALFVDVGGSCVPVPIFDGGLQGGGGSGCLRGLACVGGSCQVPPSSGPCAADTSAPCELSAHYCDATGNCQAKQAVGATCDPNLGGNDCESGNCGNGTCVGSSATLNCPIP